jgi:hypothetical protein
MEYLEKLACGQMDEESERMEKEEELFSEVLNDCLGLQASNHFDLNEKIDKNTGNLIVKIITECHLKKRSRSDCEKEVFEILYQLTSEAQEAAAEHLYIWQ